MKTFFCSSIYTLIYETGLTKNFVISLNLPSFSLFTELFAYVVFLWLGICVEVATDRISPISLDNSCSFNNIVVNSMRNPVVYCSAKVFC